VLGDFSLDALQEGKEQTRMGNLALNAHFGDLVQGFAHQSSLGSAQLVLEEQQVGCLVNKEVEIHLLVSENLEGTLGLDFRDVQILLNHPDRISGICSKLSIEMILKSKQLESKVRESWD
jgi:hypothetical protein